MVMPETMEILSTIIDVINRVFERMSLEMNMDKIKVTSNAHIVPTPVKVGDSVLEVVAYYFYLG